MTRSVDLMADQSSDPAPQILATLVGGPSTLSQDQRLLRVSASTDRIKVPSLGGYEHFERAADGITDAPSRFHWVMRTSIAE